MYPPRTGPDPKDRESRESRRDDRPRRRSPSPQMRRSPSPRRRTSPRRRSPSPSRGRRSSPSYNEYKTQPPPQPSSSTNMYPNRTQGDSGGFRGGGGGGFGGGGGAGADYLDRYVVLFSPLKYKCSLSAAVEFRESKPHYLRLCGLLHLAHRLDQCKSTPSIYYKDPC